MSERPDITMEIEASREMQQTPVDATLSIQGMAADAKATGDAITEVSDYVGSGTLPRSATSVLNALTIISNLIGNEALPSGATTLAGALSAIANELGEGYGQTSLTDAITAITTQMGDTPLPLGAETVTDALDKLLMNMVRSVNGVTPDSEGNVDVEIDTGVMTINGNAPDQEGNIEVDVDLSNLKVNGVSPDENSEIEIDIGARTVNGEQPDENGDVEINVGVKTINSEEPDENGDIEIDRVKWADDLYTEDTQIVTGSFIQRSTAGAASVQDGTGIVNHFRGQSVRTGYSEETHSMTVVMAEREEEEEEEEELSAEIDWDVFRAAVANVDTELTIAFDGESWDYDLAIFGIEIVSGTPIAGDQIVISFVAEVRGEITNTTPMRFVSTGWNLYDNSTGYARVVAYSEIYGYRIDGTYTSLSFATEMGGEETAVVPDENGLFMVTEDGYIHVTGGNDTSTAIYTTWSDWIDGTPDPFEAYTTYAIQLNTVINSIFAAGMCSVNETYDELNPATGAYTRRINRVEYSAVNLASVIAGGTDYWYDENYIYYVLSSPITGTVTMESTVQASSHGIEFFEGTEIPVYTEILYGQNLKDKLRRDVLTISKQDLGQGQKTQVRENIGAVGSSEAVMYTIAQTLTTAQQAQARQNIGAAGAAETVKYTVQQNLTDAQKTQARNNIGVETIFDRTRSTWENNKNANDYTTVGLYALGTGCTNIPVAYMALYVTKPISGITAQLAVKAGQQYYRQYVNNAWSKWTMIGGKLDIANSISLSGTNMTFSNKAAVRTGEMIMLSFTVTTSSQITAGNAVNITMTSTNEYQPMYNSWIGGATVASQVYNASIISQTTTTSNVTFVSRADISAGYSVTINVLYICNGQ